MDGYYAFGKPVPDFRQDEAYREARSMGLSPEQAFEAVGKIAKAIQDDAPRRVLGRAQTSTSTSRAATG